MRQRFQVSTGAVLSVENLAGIYNDADFGFWAVVPATIGDQVFIDVDGNGLYNPTVDTPLANITVRLFRDNVEIATTVSGPDGTYLFGNLGPGTYRVEVDANDPDVPTGLYPGVAQYTVTLAIGQDFLEADFPFVPLLVKAVDKANANAGDTLTYTITPRYQGSDLLTGVQVLDTVPTGTTFSSAGQGGANLPPVTWNLGSTAAASEGNKAVSSGTGTITFVNFASNFIRAGTSIDVDKPTGTNGNDVMIASFSWRGGTGVTPVVPTGWVQIGATANSGTDHGQASFYKIAGPSEPASYTFGLSDSQRFSVGVLTYRGVDTTNPINVHAVQVNASSSSAVAPSITPTVPNTRLVSTFASRLGTPTITTWPSGMTSRFDISSQDGGGQEGGNAVADQAIAAANVATNTRTATLRQAAINIGRSIALAPASGPSYDTTTALSANRSLVTTGDTVTVTLTASATGDAGTVEPGLLTATGTNGASASCSAASPASAVVNDSSATFTYTCAVTAGSQPGVLTFKATPSDDNGDWAEGTANTVLVTPPLTYSVTVDSSPAPALVRNTAQITSVQGIPTAASNEVTTVINAGIGDRVWTDLNGDGVQDPGEPGLAGVEVCRSDGTSTVCTTTDATGRYLFGGLSAGTYSVSVTLATAPDGFLATTPTVLTGITLIGGQQYLDADFGLRPPLPPNEAGSIGDTVWLDANNNGVLDDGEAGLPGITVILERLIGSVWTPAGSTTTGANGNYLFNGLPAGDYRVSVDGNSPVTSPYDPAVTSTIGEAMSLTNGFTSPTATINLGAGENYLLADFPYNWGGSIGDFVWYDGNANGVPDAGDGTALGSTGCETAPCGAPGATLVLYYDVNGNGAFDPGIDISIATFETGNDGAYLFSNLPPGNYVVVASEQEVPSPTTGAVNTMVHTVAEAIAVVLGPNEAFRDADFGLAEVALIEGTLFHDANNNGLREDGETLLAGITVTLTGTDQNGNPVTRTTTTDADGEYRFLVIAGNYTITYNTGETSTAGFPSNTTPLSLSVEVQNGIEYGGLDFGVNYSGALGDRVWNDANGDGIQTPGELGIPGVTVELYESDGTTLLRVTVTDANGNYSFPGLADRDYVVRVLPPDGFSPTGEGEPGTKCDDLGPPGCDNAITATVENGNPNNSVDFGYGANVDTYSVSGTVWDDNGAGGGTAGDGTQNGGEPGIPNVTVTLVTVPIIDGKVDLNGDGQITAADTGTYGGYVVTAGVLDGAAVGQTVNGITVVAGAGGGLLDVDGNTIVNASDDRAASLVGATTTNGSGDYSFLGVLNGDYLIRVDPATLPNGAYVQTGDPDGCSVDPRTCVTPNQTTIRVNNADVVDRDFGYLQNLGSIAGSVCYGDGDGQCALGEARIPGVEIRLYLQDAIGVFQPVGQPVTTGPDGAYLFENLVPGIYQVRQTNPPFLLGALADADGGNPDNISVVLGIGQNVDGRDFEEQALGSFVLGDRVWLDENSNGVQDAGEVGLANVRVELYDAAGITLLATTLTDADGGYLFTGVTAGTYQVQVATTGPNALPAGLAANPTFDLDGVATAHTTQAIVGTGAGNRDADFGYNWASTLDVLTPDADAKGAIGDRVWIDANGDGVQDPGEPGLGGVPVAIYFDSTGDGVVDSLYTDAVDQNGATGTGTTITNADGSYVFANLPAGPYAILVNNGVTPSGYTQTGDPDGVLDNRTTSPIVLAPGDVFVNADFGYRPAVVINVSGSVYLDTNADGTLAGEPGIPGVTVNLVDASGNILATVTTDTDGRYTFTGVPDGTYRVIVGDTANVLALLQQSGDPDAVLDGQTPVTVVGASVADLDFGYTPLGHSPGAGLIGDTIFLDRNGNNALDPGEGLQGVIVGLYDGTGTNLIASTVTDANGNYWFGGLADGTYVVKVDTSTLPNGGLGLTNTFDPDDVTAPPHTGDSQSTVQILGGNIDLEQDFGYQVLTDPNSISGTIWTDANADGTLDGVENGRFAGVTVVLRDENGNIVATTTTDSDGNYRFTGLPDGTYSVDLTDTAKVLTGLWHSLGTAGDGTANGTTAGQSQAEPYSVTVSDTAGRDAVVDFGYYGAGASIGDFVWHDVNQNGIQDPDEPGIPGVAVRLTITWPNAAGTTVLTTVTDANGFYRFDNLLLDEHHTGSGAGEPTYSVSIPTLPGTATLTGQGTAETDSDNPAGTLVIPVQGAFNDTIDFGFYELTVNAIRGTVYFDADDNGLFGGDTPVGGATVTLYRDLNGDGVADPGERIGTAITAPDGRYVFPGLPDGAYLVVVTTPEGATNVNDVQGSPTDGLVAVTLSGADVIGQDFLLGGILNTYAISGTVLDDLINLGALDNPGDTPLLGVVVELRDGAGTLIATTVTDGAGNYGFANLLPGDYRVTTVTPAGATQVTDADGNGNGANLIAVTLSDADVTARDFLLDNVTTYVLSGTVRNDTGTVTGDFDPNDTPLGGVTVELRDSAGTLLAITVTEPDGSYRFDVVPGDYRVTTVTPTGATHLADADGPANGTNLIAVSVTNADVTERNFLLGAAGGGGLPAYAISGTVLEDLINLGALDNPGDTPLLGVVVELRDGAGTLIATTVTDGVGNYSFANLLPGDYQVTTMTPAGATHVTDADGDVNGKNLIEVTLSTADVSGRDFLLDNVATYVLSGTVLNDSDSTGDFTGDDTPLGGVTVELRDSAGTLLAITVTEPDGSYRFDVVPGDYRVTTVTPTGATHLADADGPDNGTNLIEVSVVDADVSGQDFLLGNVSSYAISGTVLQDTTAPGVINNPGDTPVDGVTVELRDSNGTLIATTTTDNVGNYSFGNLIPGAYQVTTVTPSGGIHVTDADGNANGANRIAVALAGEDVTGRDFLLNLGTSVLGDRVWHDTNRNGIQDPDEPGIAGVTVSLSGTDNLGQPISLTTVTDGSGNYSFPGLLPGTYVVTFTAPSGYSFTAPNQTGGLTVLADAFDSDAIPDSGNPSIGRTVEIVLTGNDPTIDAGLYLTSGDAPARISDRVWYDTNGNGIQDAGEPGAAGVTVELYDSTGNTLIATDVTDGNGLYEFAGLPAGTYEVRFLLPDAGWTFSPKYADDGAGSATSPAANGNDSDADPFTGRTDPIVLAAGQQLTEVDAGIRIAGQNPATISDRVWYDTDANGIQNVGEPGIPGVVVNLYDATGGFIATVKTDANGNYAFTGLAAGDYLVEFELPLGYDSYSPRRAGNGTNDSAPDPTTGVAAVTLLAGQTRTDIDAGMFVNGLDPILIGDYVWLDANNNLLPDDSEWLDGVDVVLYDALGVELARITTNKDLFSPLRPQANYLFTGVAQGDYRVAIDTSTLPLGTLQVADPDDPESICPSSGCNHETELLGLDADTLLVDFGYARPAFTLVKTATPQTFAKVGQVIQYEFVVTNTGALPISGPVSIDDDQTTDESCPALTTVGNGDAVLDKDESVTCTASYSIITADIDAGSVTNIASASGFDPNGNPITTPTDTETVTLDTADLALEKTVSAATPNVGDTVTYTLTLSNLGPNAATGVAVVDTLPNGLGTIGDITQGGVYSAGVGTITWSGLSVSVGTPVELSYTAVVLAPATGIGYGNAAEVTASDQYDPVPSNNQDESSLTPRQADLQVTKVQIAAPVLGQTVADRVVITPSTIVAGTRIYYLLTVENLGPDAALDVTVTDTLPAGITNVEFSRNFGNSWNSWTGTYTYQSLAADAIDHIVIRGTVAAGQAGSLTNTASIASAQTYDPVPGNNQGELETTIEAKADLDLTKAVLNASVKAGEPIDYRISVTNLGPSDATGVTIVDDVNTNVTGVEYSVDDGVSYSAWTGSYTLGALAKGAQFVLLIKGTVVANPTLQSIPNTASVSASTLDPVDDNNSESINTPLGESVDLEITKIADTESVTAGERIVYTITVTNLNEVGGFDAKNVHIDDPLDSTQFADSEYSETGVNGPWSSWTGRLALGDLAPASSKTIYLRATVKSTVTAPAVVNTAFAETDTPDSDPENNQAREETPVQRSADLKMEKKLRTAPENVVAGGQVEYELVYTNLGPSDATNVVVTDDVPDEITNPEAAFCTTATYRPWTGSANVGTVVAGGVCRIFLRGTLAADYKGSLTNISSVRSDVDDPDEDNNEDSREITVLNPSISLRKDGTLNDDDGKTGVSAGDTISYVFTVTNTGNAPLSTVTVSDPQLPDLECETIASLAASEEKEVTCTAGAFRTLTQANIDAGTFTNTATVTGQYPGVPDVTNSDDDEQTLTQTPELTLNKELIEPPDPILVGSSLSYRITATNTGNITLANVVVSDDLITPNQQVCASLLPEATCVLQGTYEVTAANALAGEVVNTATADSDRTDPIEDKLETPVPIPAPPVAENDQSLGNPIGAVVTLDVVDNDSASAGLELDATTVVIVGAPDDGKALVVPGEGTWTVNPDTGAITFTPEADFTGDPTPIQYEIQDNAGQGSNPATVTITYTVAPVANDDADLGNVPGTAVTLAVPANDTASDGRTLDPTSVELAGADPGSDGKTLTVDGEGVWTVDPNTGAITFTPDAGFVLDPTPVQYRIADDQGNRSNLATVTVDYVPVAVDDASLGNPIGQPVTLDVTANDTNGDTVDPATVVIVEADAGSDGKTKTVAGEGVWTVDPDTGAITFTPEADFEGDPTPISYTVEDAQGNRSNPATVTVTYTVAPVANDDADLGNVPGTAVTLAVPANDTASDGRTLDPTSVELAGADPGSDGKTLTVDGEGVWTVDPNTGAITFTPDAGFVLDPTPVQYTITDDQGNRSNLATVTVDYIPVAVDDESLGNPIGAPVTISVTDNDTDGDTVDPTTVQIVAADTGSDGKTKTVAGEGVWTVDPDTGAITFMPEAGFTGDPTPITYSVEDDEGNRSDPATVTITYTVAPVAQDDEDLGNVPGTAVTLAVPANDAASDGRTLDLTSVEIDGADAGSGGKTLTVDGEGVWTVDPNTGAITFTPADEFTLDPTPVQYSIADDQGNRSNLATVTVDYVPVAVDDASLGNPIGQPVTLDVTANDTNGDTVDPATVVIVEADAGSDGKTKTVAGEGVWTVDPDTGAITFTPEADFEGDPTPISYTVEDDQGNRSNEASVTVTYLRLPSLTVVKIADPLTYAALDDEIIYRYQVTNSGNVTITALVVNDDRITAPNTVSCAETSLAPEGETTCTASYRITQPDLDAGEVTNKASASGQDPLGQSVISDEVQVTVRVDAADLALEKTVSAATPNVGDTVTYTLTLSNLGPNPATGVAVVDTLPNGLGTIGNISQSGVYSEEDGTITWSGLAVSVGTPVELSYTAVVLAPEDGILYTNTAAVTASDQYDPVPSNNEDDATLTPRQADLQVTKVQIAAPVLGQTVANRVVITPSTIVAGTRIYYLLTVENLGPDAALDVTVTDTLPAGITNVEFSRNFGNSWNSWTGTYTYQSLAADAIDHIVIRGTVAAGQADNLTNTARIASAQTHDPVPGNNQDELETTIEAKADLALTKAQLVAPVEAGGSIRYRIRVTNLGPSDATDVTIADSVDANVTAVEYSVDGGTSYTPWTGSYALPEPLATGAQFVLLIQGTVVANPTVQSIPNTATVSATTADPDPDNNSERIETPLGESVDLEIEKVTDQARVTAGERIVYTLTVTNLNVGDGFTARKVHIDDPLDPTLFADIEYSITGEEGSWVAWTSRLELGDLNPGDSITRYLRATVRSDVTVATVTNRASVATDTPDRDLDNNTAEVETPVDRSADLKMEKKLRTAPENVVAGGQVEYELVYTNLGPSDATNVVVTDDVPDEITNPEAAFCTTATYRPWTGSANVGTVVAGGVCRIFLRGTLAADYQGSLTNTSSVRSDVEDPDEDNNEDSREITVLKPSIALRKVGTLNDDDGKTGVSAGDTISYVFTVTNTGNATLTNITLVDTVGGVSISGGPIETLAPEAVDDTTFTGTYRLTQADIDAGTFTNTATVTGQYPGVPDVSDSDEDIQTLTQRPALTLEKSAHPLTYAAVDDVIDYSYLVTNSGNVTLSAPFAVSDDKLAAVDCAAAPSTLAPEESFTCTASHLITQGDLDVGTLTNQATASGQDPGGQMVTSPEDSATVTADQNPELTLKKVLSASPDPIEVDSTLTYSITATNSGNITLSNVVVSDILLTPSSKSCDSLTPGETCELVGTYQVTLANALAGQVVNRATADSDRTEEIEDILTTPVPLPAAPVARDDESLDNPLGTTVTLRVLENDSASTGLSLVPTTVVLDGADAGSNGKTQTVPGEGVWTVDPVTGDITFTPEAGFTGNPTPITYRVEDDQGNQSNAAKVTVTYEIAASIVRRCLSNTPYVDYEIESGADGPLTIQWYEVLPSGERGAAEGDPLLDQPRAGRLLWPGAVVNAQGDVVSWPGWELIDGQWERTNPRAQEIKDIVFSINPTISVRVQYPEPEQSCYPYPPVPVAENDESLDNPLGSTVTIDVVQNDLAPPGRTLVPGTVRIDGADPGSDGRVKTVPGEGTWRVDEETGAISFEPEDDFLDNPTPIQYRIQDSAGETSNLATVRVTYFGAASLSLTKEIASAPNPVELGSELTYRITATNTGPSVLTNVTIVDRLPGLSPLTCDPPQPATLAPGDRIICRASYVVKQADVNAGRVINTAEVSAKTETGRDLHDEASTRVWVTRQPPVPIPGLSGLGLAVLIGLMGLLGAARLRRRM